MDWDLAAFRNQVALPLGFSPNHFVVTGWLFRKLFVLVRGPLPGQRKFLCAFGRGIRCLSIPEGPNFVG